MQPTELPPRTAKAADAPPSPDDSPRALRDEVVELAQALPGDLRRLTVRSGERAIEVEWATATPAPPAPIATAATAAPPADEGVEPEVPEGMTAVRAPLVGTFYAAPSPDADPFVREGDEVEVGQTVGIVEAMKLMNPIVADEQAVVAEIRVADANSVEYDQVLMLLRPAGRPR
ncbi:acetyl-CoA carboxylase biotin carboxyl carrier protein [Trujillonella endophytica]|uniref:Biotin carboxyl carrier protein of acetyl-CoA carboxylase n=1 Tax=Trujillonella endophytica TaxID=673521 RepID=A0A1H8WE17_9ACTN|nr:biotin/lipoyl-containing protein [Trujillella endophytica]SEP25871.1 acetyl-CoA carboxylase biotin carboxyl carrier protein [Trujillella endophytica]